MSGFVLFDPGPIADEPKTPLPRVDQRARTYSEADANPILSRPARSADRASVAKCSPSVATSAAPTHAAGNCQKSPQTPQTVASVATVAECQSGVVRFASLPRLNGMPIPRWKRLVADAQSFERVWLDRAVGLGWSVLEMFGCYRNPLAGRLDHNGLVIGLNGRAVLSLDETGAVIQDRTGSTVRFSRAFDRSGAVPLWIAFTGGRK